MQKNSITDIDEKLKTVNSAFVQIFKDFTFKSELLDKKYLAFLNGQIFAFFNQGSAEDKNNIRQVFLQRIREYLVTFLETYVATQLSNNHDDESLVSSLIEKWEQFKKYTFYCNFLLRAAENYYETAYKAILYQGKSNKLESQNSIFPVPAIALYSFKIIIFDRYEAHVIRHTLKLFQDERSGRPVNQQTIRILCEIVFSCGLRELARMRVVGGVSNQKNFQFYPTLDKDIRKQYSTEDKNPQRFFKDHLLIKIAEGAVSYYRNLFEEQISNLSPYEDFEAVFEIMMKQKMRSSLYFLTEKQKDFYLAEIRNVVILQNLEERLLKENSFKTYLEKYNHASDTYLHEIQTFMKPVLIEKGGTIKIVEKIIHKHLMESGDRINERINKRRQYITEVVDLKKSVNVVIETAMDKDWDICMTRDKCFKKILDSIEASRNLAEFTDWRIKESIKAKLSEDETVNKIKDIFLVLESLAATDSFLIYHQEMLGKRLIDALNEPKIQIEIMVLKKIAEKLGSVSVAPHLNMIKDIESSHQLTDKISKMLPFSSFRWALRIISPAFWPDNINKNKLTIHLPEALRMQAETIGNVFHSEQGNRYLSWKLDRGFSLFQGKFGEKQVFRFQAENIFMVILFHISEGHNQQILFGNLLQKLERHKEGDNQFLMKCVNVLIDNGLAVRDSQIKNAPFTEGEVIRVNLKYTPPSSIKPNQIIMIKVSPEMGKAMQQTSVEQGRIMKEREKIVEAVLVKLLKHSHSMGSNKMYFKELYQGICEHQHLSNFSFSESVVKKILEELMARGFCERDKDDRKIYRYVA